MKLIESQPAVVARCPLSHTWDTSLEVWNTGIVRKQGRRAHARFEYRYAILHCPTCGQRCVGSVPKQVAV